MKTYFIDSFTNQKFKGNPAAVCFPEDSMDANTMQRIATEIGFSETAFVEQISNTTFSIRFFTPKKEIPLCGHATLASSKVIFDTTSLEKITFLNTENVELGIRKSGEQIVMEFPVYDVEAGQIPSSTLDALGIDNVVEVKFSAKNKIVLVEIPDSDVLAGLQPDFHALVKSLSNINGILVTAKSNNPHSDFHYRYFWPWTGTNEDPVTGGVHTFLTKYWSIKLGKNKLRAFQSSLRTGTMTTELKEDKVLIYGHAVTVFEGEFKN